MPEEYLLYGGVSLGYADPDAPINGLRIGREPVDQVVTMIGLDAPPANGQD